MPNYQPKGFNDLFEARMWVKHFVDWYNNDHRHSGINYVTPNERHAGKDKEILAERIRVYEEARSKAPGALDQKYQKVGIPGYRVA